MKHSESGTDMRPDELNFRFILQSDEQKTYIMVVFTTIKYVIKK